jgi:hypothetical protein
MKQNDINWINYNKILSASDAFIYVEDLVAYLHYQCGTDLPSAQLPNNFYTSGTTDNPDDYSLPEVKSYNKLSRINPFNKSSSISIHSYIEGLEGDSIYPQNIKTENIEQQELEFINADSKIFLDQIKKLQKTNYNDVKVIYELLKTSDKLLKSSYFDLGSRSYSTNIESLNIEEEVVIKDESPKIEFKEEENNEEIKIEEINYERYEFQNENISIDINNFDEKNIIQNQEYQNVNVENQSNVEINNKTDNNFEYENSTNYIEENNTLVNIENRINQEIINLENKIFNSTLTKVEFNEIKYQIFNQLDSLIEKKTTTAIEEFREKNKVEVEKMFGNFLRS